MPHFTVSFALYFICFFLALSKLCQIGRTVRIFFEHRPKKCESPPRPPAMAQREVIALDTILRNDGRRTLHKILTRPALFKHSAQTRFLENVAEEIFRVTRHPTITLGHVTARVY